MKSQFLIIPILLLSCQSADHAVDFEKEKKAIMVLHNEQRKAHMEKNAALLVGDTLIDFIEVNRGVVRKPVRAESLLRFQSYFNSVDFIKWDDVAEPIFSFSDDGTMATTVVQKLVITREKTERSKIDTTSYTWLAVYKKIDGKWRLHRMASTNK